MSAVVSPIPVRHRKGPPSQKAECNNTFSLQLTLTLTLAPTPFAMADLCDGGPPPFRRGPR